MNDQTQTPDPSVTCIAEHLIRTYCTIRSADQMLGILAKKSAEGRLDAVDREILRLMDAGEYDRIMGKDLDIVDMVALSVLQTKTEGNSHE